MGCLRSFSPSEHTDSAVLRSGSDLGLGSEDRWCLGEEQGFRSHPSNPMWAVAWKCIMQLMNLVYQLVIAEKQTIPKLSGLEQQSFIIFYDSRSTGQFYSKLTCASELGWHVVKSGCLGADLILLKVCLHPSSRLVQECSHGGGRVQRQKQKCLNIYLNLCLCQVITVSWDKAAK